MNKEWTLYNSSACRKIMFALVDKDEMDYDCVNIWSYQLDPTQHEEMWLLATLNSHGLAGIHSDRSVVTVSVEKAREIWNELRRMGYGR